MKPAWRAFTAVSYRRDTSGGRDSEAFAFGAGPILGDVNHVHPFREGNGRTQLQYPKQLAGWAGRDLHLTRMSRDAGLGGSRRRPAPDAYAAGVAR